MKEELFKSILCPIDYDELCLDALELSKNLALKNDAKLYVLHVISEFDSNRGWKAGGRLGLLQHVREQLAGKIPYEFVIRTGDVVSEILAATQVFDSDLIVIPTHGRRGLKSLILGSVAERVVRESPIPVLTLRAR